MARDQKRPLRIAPIEIITPISANSFLSKKYSIDVIILFMHWVYLFLGLAAMLVGADWLVRGCVRFCRRYGISEFIVSAIVVGIGTSMPELLVSFISGARGLGALVISNSIASNIVNIWGVIGIGALVTPIAVRDKRSRLSDLIFLGVATAAVSIMIWLGEFGFFNSLILLAILGAYLWHGYSCAVADKDAARMRKHPYEVLKNAHIWHVLILIAAGILGMYLGSEVFMDSLEAVASANRLDQTMVGILIVAPGTAVPELMVTIMAALKRHPQIAIGNIIGSNFMNLALVIPAGAIMARLPVSAHIAKFDTWVMIAATVMLFFDLLHRRSLSRWHGVLYLMLLGAYMWLAVVANA
jgi:cation:H+ antiporter